MPEGTEWMEHELKLDAGPHSPTSIYLGDELRLKVREPQTEIHAWHPLSAGIRAKAEHLCIHSTCVLLALLAC